jgi:hypothetical protein
VLLTVRQDQSAAVGPSCAPGYAMPAAIVRLPITRPAERVPRLARMALRQKLVVMVLLR